MNRIVASILLVSALLPTVIVAEEASAPSSQFMLKQIAQIATFPAEVQVVRASNDGKELVVGWCKQATLPGGAQVFRGDTLNPISPVLDVGGGDCSDAAYSPDGKYLATLTSNSTLRFWDRRQWKQVGRDAYPVWDWQIVMHPKLPECLTVGGHPEISRWAMPSGELIATFKAPFKRVVSAAITADGQRVVMLGRAGDTFQVQVRAYPSFELLTEFPQGQETGFLSRLALSADQRQWVMAQSSGAVWVAPLDDPSALRILKTPLTRTHNLVFLDDSSLLLHGWSRPLAALDLRTGACSTSNVASSGGGKGLAMLTQPRRLALAHGGADRSQGVSVWELPSNDPVLAALASATPPKASDAKSSAMKPGRSQPDAAPAVVAGPEAELATGRPSAGGKEPSPQRRQVPDPDAVEQAQKELEKLLNFDDRDEPDAELSARLLKLAAEEPDPVMTFAMLNLAARNAVAAFDTSTAQRTLDDLESRYVIDTLRLAGKLLYQVRDRPIATDERRRMASWAEELGDQALGQEEVAFASAFYNISVNWSAFERADLRRRREKARAVDALLPDFRQVAEAREQLDRNPQDPQANARWGKYLCFVRGNWQQGLPALAIGDDEELRRLAQADLSVDQEVGTMLQVAKQWADFAADQGDVKARQHANASAKFWYRRALSQLKGVDRLRVQSLIEAIELPDAMAERSWPRSPLADD